MTRGASGQWPIVRARIAFVERCVAKGMLGEQIIEAVKARFSVATRTAHYDIAAAYARIAKAEDSDTSVRAGRMVRVWTRRMMRLEKLVGAALKQEEWGAAASFEAQANVCADRLTKIYGLFAPKKIQISGSVGMQVHVSFDTTKIVDVLDLDGLKALRLVMAQVDAAKQSGRLKPIDVPSESAQDPLLADGDDLGDDDGQGEALDTNGKE